MWEQKMQFTYTEEALGTFFGRFPQVSISGLTPGQDLSEMQAVVILLARIEKRLERIEINTD